MRYLKEEGFTLLELIMLLVILGIASAVLVPKFTVGRANVAAVARQIQSDIRYAQEIAMSKYKAKSIVFTAGSSTYGFSPSDPSDPTAKIPPNSRVSITNSVTFTFNSLGEPTSGAGSSVSLSGGGTTKTVNVQDRTGRAVIQ